MSYNVTESDAFPSSVPTPEVNDTSYPTVIPQMATALASRTKYLNTTLMTGGASSFGADDLNPNATAATLTTITLPASGRADLFRSALTGLAQSIRWLRERTPGAGAVADTLHWNPALIGANSTFWGADSSSSATSSAPYINQKTTDGAYAKCSIPQIRAGLVFGTLTATVQSATSHAGNLPAVMPRLALVGVDSTGTGVEIAGADDTSANTTAYEAMHTISCPVNTAVATGLAYHVAIRGESSTDAQNNSFKLYRLSMTLWYV